MTTEGVHFPTKEAQASPRTADSLILLTLSTVQAPPGNRRQLQFRVTLVFSLLLSAVASCRLCIPLATEPHFNSRRSALQLTSHPEQREAHSTICTTFAIASQA